MVEDRPIAGMANHLYGGTVRIKRRTTLEGDPCCIVIPVITINDYQT